MVVDGSVYTAADDASWAVVGTDLSNEILNSDRQRVYDSFMEGCRRKAGDMAYSMCDNDDNHRRHMNVNQPRSVRSIIVSIVKVFDEIL